MDLVGATMLARRRKKGKGANAWRQPMLPIAVDAFRALDAADAGGPFSASSVRKSFQRACRAVRAETGMRLGHLRFDDSRHSFGSMVYRATGSLAAAPARAPADDREVHAERGR